MKYGQAAGVNKPVSRLVQGTMMINQSERERSYALLDGVYELGGNTFDTAHIYGGGDTERVFGDWLQDRGVREEIVIIAKGAHHNADRKRVTPFDISADLHDSLARFKTDYIDLYLLHRDDPEVPVGPIVEVLNEHARAGRIRAFGGSNWTVERIRDANRYARAHGLISFVASSPQFSLAEQVEEPWRECVSIGGEQGRDDREWYQDEQIAVFAWSSLASGFFSGRFNRENMSQARGYFEELCRRCYGYEENFIRLDRATDLAAKKHVSVTQIALAYVLCQPLNLFPLVGCATKEEFATNSEALNIDLTPQELAWLDLGADNLA